MIARSQKIDSQLILNQNVTFSETEIVSQSPHENGSSQSINSPPRNGVQSECGTLSDSSNSVNSTHSINQTNSPDLSVNPRTQHRKPLTPTERNHIKNLNLKMKQDMKQLYQTYNETHHSSEKKDMKEIEQMNQQLSKCEESEVSHKLQQSDSQNSLNSVISTDSTDSCDTKEIHSSISSNSSQSSSSQVSSSPSKTLWHTAKVNKSQPIIVLDSPHSSSPSLCSQKSQQMKQREMKQKEKKGTLKYELYRFDTNLTILEKIEELEEIKNQLKAVVNDQQEIIDVLKKKLFK